MVNARNMRIFMIIAYLVCFNIYEQYEICLSFFCIVLKPQMPILPIIRPTNFADSRIH